MLQLRVKVTSNTFEMMAFSFLSNVAINNVIASAESAIEHHYENSVAKREMAHNAISALSFMESFHIFYFIVSKMSAADFVECGKCKKNALQSLKLSDSSAAHSFLKP